MFYDIDDNIFGKTFDLAIIGAGIQGLAVAYELSKRRAGKICVIDASWPGSGASSRNGEMIRSIFSSNEWVSLFDCSLKRWHELSAEFGENILFNSDGYIVLASTEEYFEQQKQIQAQHAQYRLRSKLISEADITRLIPSINPELVVGGIFQEGAGHAHHDAVLSAYFRGAKANGVQVACGTPVTSIRTHGNKVTGLETPRGAIHAGTIINAAGAGSQLVNAMVGLALPVKVARLEILVTDAMRSFLPVALAVPHLLGYCHQTARGEFVGGTERPQLDETSSLNTTFSMLKEMAERWVKLFPMLAGAPIRRNWAGAVSVTPDMAPVIGWAPGLEGLYLNMGWIYGFMGAPGAGLLIAEHLITGTQPAILAPFGAERLIENRLIEELSLVV